jgi:site-specific recombinase XerD
MLVRYIEQYKITDWFITTRKREKMSYMTLRTLIDEIGERINYHFTAHQLRHSIATHLYNGDMDLLALRDFLGHTDVQTTQQYVRVYVTSVQRKYNKAQLVKNIY